MDNLPLEQQEKILQKIRVLRGIFAKAAIGDFSEDVPLSNDFDEFTELYVGIQIMLDVIRDTITKLESEVKIAEEKEDLIARHEEEFRALSENSPDLISLFNRELRYVYVNPKVAQLTGIAANEYVGKSFKELNLPSVDLEYWSAHISSVFETGKEEILEFTFSRNGITNYFHTRLVPIQNKRGTVEQVLGFAHDVTDLKRAERMKDEFLAMASHELRTPLTAMKGIISMVSQGKYGPITPELHEPLEDMMQATDRLLHIANDTLSVARLESGQIQLALSTVDLDEVIKTVVAMFLPLCKQKNILLTVKAQTNLRVIADRAKVLEILENLLGNAVKFTDKGGIQIACSLEGNFISIAVSDTGIGLSTEDQSKLFQKFIQINRETHRPGGTGLGLYIAQSLARKMGGNLVLQSSELGKGSTFTLTLATADKTY